jgi:hypothetical protein
MKNHPAPFSIEDPRRLWARHRLALFGGILSLCFSVAIAGTLMNLTYFADASDEFSNAVFLVGGGTACVAFGVAQSIILHGYSQWVWLQVGVFMTYVLLVLPTVIYSPDRVLFTLAVLSPLIGLLCLNSKRQREMRHKMVELRHKREAIIAPLKQQGRWKCW